MMAKKQWPRAGRLIEWGLRAHANDWDLSRALGEVLVKAGSTAQ